LPASILNYIVSYAAGVIQIQTTYIDKKKQGIGCPIPCLECSSYEVCEHFLAGWVIQPVLFRQRYALDKPRHVLSDVPHGGEPFEVL
jgi:hypothetical protein